MYSKTDQTELVFSAACTGHASSFAEECLEQPRSDGLAFTVDKPDEECGLIYGTSGNYGT